MKPISRFFLYLVFTATAYLLYLQPSFATEFKSIRSDFDQRVSGIRSLGILIHNFNYFDRTFFGVTEQSDALSNQATQSIVNAIKEYLGSKGLETKTISLEGVQKESLQEIAQLYDTIALSYSKNVTYARGQDIFQHKAESFDYSVGSIEDILESEKVDGLFLITGGGVGRSFFNPGSIVIATGIVDKSGMLVWHDIYIQLGNGFLYNRDVFTSDGSRKIVGTIFKSLPVVRK